MKAQCFVETTFIDTSEIKPNWEVTVCHLSNQKFVSNSCQPGNNEVIISSKKNDDFIILFKPAFE